MFENPWAYIKYSYGVVNVLRHNPKRSRQICKVRRKGSTVRLRLEIPITTQILNVN